MGLVFLYRLINGFLPWLDKKVQPMNWWAFFVAAIVLLTLASIASPVLPAFAVVAILAIAGAAGRMVATRK
jgi:hypothetical protein